MLWGSHPELWSWYFRETNQRFPHSYQVERPRFDQILLEHAETCGVKVFQETPIQDIELNGDSVQSISSDGQRIEFDYVIDASGQASLLANRFHSKQHDEKLLNLAAYGYFEGADHLEGADAGNILIESVDTGWIWKIPLRNGITSVGVVADRDASLPRIREIGVDEWFRTTLSQSKHVSHLLSVARLTSGISVTRDWSYCASNFSGPNYCLVGDAACFIDPLFSTGVHLAVSGGFLASALVHTRFVNENLYRESQESYEALYKSQYSHFQELVHLFYGGNRTKDSYFWQTRKITSDDDYSPRQSFVRLVSGQSEFGYERAVLDRASLPNEYVDGISAIEARRVSLRALLNDHGLASVTFRKSSEVNVRPGVVLEESQFVRGWEITGSARDSLPINEFVASVWNAIEGSMDLKSLLIRLETKYRLDDTLRDQVQQTVRLLLLDDVLELDPDPSSNG